MEPSADPVDRWSIKRKQSAYHDYEALTYEDKFSISYDDRCIDYAAGRFRKVVPEGTVRGRILEVGAGTGFFLINLALGSCIDGELHATDLSEGMLAVCKRNATEHGLAVEARQGDAEALPYDDDTFDLVLGHAFLHHLPVPGAALQEFHRVLRPGGQLVVAGEPTELGDRTATVVKRATYRTFRAVTALPGLGRYRRPTLEQIDDPATATLAGLEHVVDLHTFRPRDVAHMARIAGFGDVEVTTEELVSNWAGWVARTVEGSVTPGTLGARWATTAYRTYRTLNAIDEQVLRRVLPGAVFYNLILHATKPLDVVAAGA